MRNLEVGCADATIIAADDKHYLIDCHDIHKYTQFLPRSRQIHGVFITHQHRDHYSGLEYLRDQGYQITYLVYSPYARRRNDGSVALEEWNEFNALHDHFVTNGTKAYRPYRQESWDKPWWTPPGLRIWMLGPTRSLASSETREIHDACLVMKVAMGQRACTFTGDASDANLQKVAGINHICGDILHASHHGSINGADLTFIKKCSANYTVISTLPGVHNGIPHTTALRRYQENTARRVYRTDVDGTITWEF